MQTMSALESSDESRKRRGHGHGSSQRRGHGSSQSLVLHLLSSVLVCPAVGFQGVSHLPQLRTTTSANFLPTTNFCGRRVDLSLPLQNTAMLRDRGAARTCPTRRGAADIRMQESSSIVNRPTALATPTFGETGGAILLVEGVSLSAGARDIVLDANLKVNQGDVVGLVGLNGAGKSTLLSAVAGRRPLDGGKALVKPETTVGYLVQTAVSGSDRSAWDEAASGMERIAAAELELAEAERVVASGQVTHQTKTSNNAKQKKH